MANQTYVDSSEVLAVAGQFGDLHDEALSIDGDIGNHIASASSNYGAGLDKYGAVYAANLRPALNGGRSQITGVANGIFGPAGTKLVSYVGFMDTADGINRSLATNLGTSLGGYV